MYTKWFKNHEHFHLLVMDGWMDGWMKEWMYGWMDGWILHIDYAADQRVLQDSTSDYSEDPKVVQYSPDPRVVQFYSNEYR